MDTFFTWTPSLAGMKAAQHTNTVANGYKTNTIVISLVQASQGAGNLAAKLLKYITFFCLSLGLINPTFAFSSFSYASSPYPIYESTVLYAPQFGIQENKQPNIFLKKEDKKKSVPKIHPRKKLLEEAPMYTQKAWLYSAIIPGLGQLYNKSYWEIPVIYGIFGLLTWGAIYNHNEYTNSKRELIDKCKPNEKGKVTDESSFPNLVNYMDSRKRDRTIFVASMFIWYLLNVFEAYVGGTLKTFDVSDDLEVVIQPSENNNIFQNTNVGLSVSLQSKNQDEDRNNWIW